MQSSQEPFYGEELSIPMQIKCVLCIFLETRNDKKASLGIAVSSGTCCLLLRSRTRFLRELKLGHNELQSAGARPTCFQHFPGATGWSKSVTPGETLGDWSGGRTAEKPSPTG